MLHSAAPWAALLHRLDPEDEGKGALEMTPQVGEAGGGVPCSVRRSLHRATLQLPPAR